MTQSPLTVRRWKRAEYDRLVELGAFDGDPVELIAGQLAVAASVCFDAALFEIWGALLAGAELIIIPIDIVTSPRALAPCPTGCGEASDHGSPVASRFPHHTIVRMSPWREKRSVIVARSL